MKKFTPYQIKMAVYIGLGLFALLVLWRLTKGIDAFFGIEPSPDFTPVPMPTADTTGINLTTAEAQMVRSMSQRLHTDMQGVSLPGTADTEVYERLLELTDPLLVAVYNDFGHLYYSEDEGTLRQWLNDEQFWYTFSILTPFGIFTARQFTEAINQRFDLLNLQ